MSFVKQRLGTKWYSGTNPQEAMSQNAQQHEHKARVVVMDSKGYRSYGSYTSWEVAIVHLQSLQEKVSKHHFELIAETERCKPYFDFDYVYTTKDNTVPINIKDFCCKVEATLQPILQRLTGCSSESIESNNCFIWSESCSSTKFSLHLVIHLVLENDQGIKELWLCKSTERAKYLCIEMLRISPELEMFSDTKVYTRNRTMRMCGSRKWSKDGEKPILRLLRLTYTGENYLKSIITWFEEDPKLLQILFVPEEENSYSLSNEKISTEPSESSLIKNYINDFRKDNVVTKVERKIDNQDRLSFLITTKIRWCPKIKREHNGNHQFAIINKSGLSFYCHDLDCQKHRYSTKAFSSLPTEIKALFEAHPSGTPIDEEGVRSDVQMFVKSVINDVEQDGMADLDYDLRQIVSLLQPSALLQSLSGHTCGNNFTAQIDQSGIKFVCQTCGMTWPKDTTVAHSPATYTKLCDFLHLNINVNSFNNLTNTNIGNVNSTSGQSEALLDLSERLRDVTFNDSDLIAADLTDHDQVRCVLMNCLHSVENDTVAELLYVLYSDRLRCLGDREGWYEYRSHRWYPVHHLVPLALISDLKKYFIKLLKWYKKNKKDNTKRILKVEDAIKTLGGQGFKSSTLTAAEMIFYTRHQEFEKIKDQRNLLVFGNGVIDLDTEEMTLRDGSPHDCATKGTSTDYIAYNATCPIVKEIEEWMVTVQPDSEQRHYLKKSLGYAMSRLTCEQFLFIWTGKGQNGKTYLQKLLNETFQDDYCDVGAHQLLTRKREDAGDTNSSLMRLVDNEPTGNEKLQADVCKNITGEDPMTCRDLHEKAKKILILFTSILLCNEIPKASEDTYAFWRRLMVISWPVTFKANLTPEEESTYLKKLDKKKYDKKIKEWAPYVTGIVVEWHRIYKLEGLIAPPVVEEHIQKYKDESDPWSKFTNQYIECNSAGFIQWTALYDKFGEWHKENIDSRVPQKALVKQYFEKKVFDDQTDKPCRFQGIIQRGWKGYRFME